MAVLRTFSKAYGLAGLPVGYCIAPAGIAAHVRRTQVPFSVSALAQRAAVVAFGEGAEFARRAALTVVERDRVTGRLRAMGHAVPESQSSFVWLPLGDAAETTALDAGVHLVENLDDLPADPSSALAELPGSGAHFVTGRFRVVRSRRHAPPATPVPARLEVAAALVDL